MTHPTFTENITRILVEEGLVLGTDFTIDLHSERIIILKDKARDRFLEMFPMFTLSSAITEKAEAGWQIVASFSEKPPDHPEFENEEINALLRSFTQEKPC